MHAQGAREVLARRRREWDAQAHCGLGPGAWKFGTGAAAHGGGSWRCFVRYLVTHVELEPAALAVAEVGEGEKKERKKGKGRAWTLEGRSVTPEQ